MEQNPYQVIRSNYPAFPRVSRVIADYIFQDPERMLDVSVHQMARDLAVAESSIIRFCHLNQFSGFRELKIMLARYGHPQGATIFETLADDDPEAITRNIFARSVETLQYTVEQLDFQAVAGVAELVNRAERIILCGIGASASIADNFAVHLMRIGLQAVSITDSELLQVAARLSDEHTLLIAVSKSGRNIPLVNAFRLAKEQGAKTACMTGYTQTPLGRCCDVSIAHYCPETALVSTRIVQNTIIDCICVNATIHRQDEVRETLKENRRVLENLRL